MKIKDLHILLEDVPDHYDFIVDYVILGDTGHLNREDRSLRLEARLPNDED